MQAHNQAATRMFTANSAKLQREKSAQPKVNAQELSNIEPASREQATPSKRLEKGDYAGLRLETAKGQSKSQQQEKPQIEEGKLSFTRDRKRQDIENAPQKPELKEGELSFSRSPSAQALTRGR